MSENRESQTILIGSWNILPPGDKVPENDALELLGFRVDQAGVLRSVWTPPATILGQPSAEPVHTLLLPGDTKPNSAGLIYVGAGTSLFASNGALLAADFSSDRLGMVPFGDYIYVMNVTRRVKLKGFSTANSWLADKPTTAPFAFNNGSQGKKGPSGTYQYYVTFVTDGGLETNPGPASAPVTTQQSCGSCVVGLSNIPTSPDSAVAKRRIYRTGGQLGQAYQVMEINDNFTTTANDTFSDEEVTNLGIVMPVDNDPPPAAFGLVGPYFNRLVAFRGLGVVNGQIFNRMNRLWFSKEGVPLFPGSALDAKTGFWVDVGRSDESIVDVTQHSRMLVIYKTNSIWRLTGDPLSGTLEQTSSSIGALAAISAGPIDYFVNNDGVFRFNLDSEQRISQKIDPLFQKSTNIGASDTVVGRLSGVHCLEYLNGILLASYQDEAGKNALLGYHVETDRWSKIVLPNYLGLQNQAITALASVGSAITYFAGLSSGHAAKSGPQTVANTACKFQTRFLNQNLGDTPKVYTEVVIDHELAGNSFNVYVLYDNGKPSQPLASSFVQTITGTGRTKTAVPLGDDGATATNISVRLEGTVSSDTAIHGIYIYYYVEARLTSSVATAPFTPGDGTRALEVKEIELDASLAANGTLKLWADQVGNDIVPVATVTVGATGKRRNYQLPLSGTPRLGRIFRTALDSTQPFRLYRGRMLVRPLGCYVEDYEAANGYAWEHTPLDFGTREDKVFDQLQIELEGNGTLTAQVLTDLPGESLIVKASLPIAAAGNGRRWYTLELPTDCHGRNFQLRLPSTAGYKLYRGRVGFRRVGRYFAAASNDQFRALEADFGTERVKLCKKLEIDIETHGPVTLNFVTDGPPNLAVRWTHAIDTGGVRQPVRITLPGNTRGRLFRVDLSTNTWGRLYNLRAWVKTVGESIETPWTWQQMASEPSDALPAWVDLPIPPTPDTWDWIDIPNFGGRE